MISRKIESVLAALAGKYPVDTLTGPRQSGKSTLCRSVFGEHNYVNLEAPDTRQEALEEPRGFLSRLKRRAIIDEIQRAPELASYIQVLVDTE